MWLLHCGRSRVYPLIKSEDPGRNNRNIFRVDSRLAPSQWETLLQSNAVSHWLGANLESTLYFAMIKLRVMSVTLSTIQEIFVYLRFIFLLIWHWSLRLTHLPLDEMAAISQTIFSDPFLWMKIFVFGLNFHWSLFLRVQLTITQHWFR